MKTGTALVATLVAIASFPLLAQQSSPAGQPDSPAAQQSSPATESASPSTPAAPTAPMSPLNVELVSKLDSKTMKAGDSVTAQIKASAKTTEGTEIPKGSKLVGHVLGVQSSGGGQNSQVVLQFDHLELKGGQNLPVHSQIQSITPAESASVSGAPSAPSPSPSPDASSSPSSPSANGTAGAPQPGAGGESAAAPAPGTIVARAGKIDIRTTSVPGVLLANNAPGEQDPRMAQASSILLGAKQDIQLSGGTKMVVGVSTSGGGAQ